MYHKQNFARAFIFLNISFISSSFISFVKKKQSNRFQLSFWQNQRVEALEFNRWHWFICLARFLDWTCLHWSFRMQASRDSSKTQSVPVLSWPSWSDVSFEFNCRKLFFYFITIYICFYCLCSFMPLFVYLKYK